MYKQKNCTYATLNCFKWNYFWHLNRVLMLNWFVWNRTVLTSKCFNLVLNDPKRGWYTVKQNNKNNPLSQIDLTSSIHWPKTYYNIPFTTKIIILKNLLHYNHQNKSVGLCVSYLILYLHNCEEGKIIKVWNQWFWLSHTFYYATLVMSSSDHLKYYFGKQGM